MAWLIGTDEAGYGPNLGPLLISATVWEVPDEAGVAELYQRLAGAVVATAAEAARSEGACVAIADSKTLYQSGKGLRLLERGLWAAMGALGRRPARWSQLWETLAPGSAGQRQALPWYRDYELAVPVDCSVAEGERAAQGLCRALAAAGVRLVEVRSRAIFEAQFNRLLQAQPSKGSLLSQATLGLVAEVMAPLPDGRIQVLCDKHGGRNHYGPVLADAFPESFIEVRSEARELSVYRLGPPQRRVEIRFQAQAESHLPTALASMASKYLRELAMRAFNAYWGRQVPGLRPTAGYPQDAHRFKAQIAARQAQLGFEDSLLWRSK